MAQYWPELVQQITKSKRSCTPMQYSHAVLPLRMYSNAILPLRMYSHAVLPFRLYYKYSHSDCTPIQTVLPCNTPTQTVLPCNTPIQTVLQVLPIRLHSYTVLPCRLYSHEDCTPLWIVLPHTAAQAALPHWLDPHSCIDFTLQQHP